MTLKGERLFAGLRCSDVLARLSAYLDGELAPEERAQLEAHVKECSTCARMGGELAAVVRALRERLGAEPLPDDVAARLDAALEKL